MNRNEQIQSEILNLLKIKDRTINSLYNTVKDSIVDITIKQYEANLSELKSIGKIEIVSLIYVKLTNK